MRVLALDIGDIRTGLAISDPTGRVASPLCVIPTAEALAHARSFRHVLEDWEPELLLAGLPRTLAGDTGAQAQHITQLAQKIADNCGLSLKFCDERLSSEEAKRILRDQGLTQKQMRGKIDMIAASLFLQTWLDAAR